MHNIYSKYLSDPEIRALTSDEKFIGKMLQVEIALAKVQSQLGIIPKSASYEITKTLCSINIDPDDLAEETRKNGIPTIALLSIVKKSLSEATQNFIHWGATSQDIVDTANILIIKEVIHFFEKRVTAILTNLKELVKIHSTTIMVGRTRTQHAVPITFGQKVQSWFKPLERHLERLDQLKPRLLNVQLGGATGNLSAFGKDGKKIAKNLSVELNLGYIGVWHTQRDNIAEFSSWMALVSGSLGKIASDILLLSQTEINEVNENGLNGGKSSTMPHKNNPVLSEAMVALSNYISQLAVTGFQAMLHSQERDASAWALEWLALPEMMTACGAILNHAIMISENIRVNTKMMQVNIEKSNGLIFSERASFELAKTMPRNKAKLIVKLACELVIKEEIHLMEAFKKILPNSNIDWHSVFKI